MTKEQKLALGIGLLVVVATLLALLVLKPAPDVWSKAEHLRQVVGLGVAGLVLALVIGAAERSTGPKPK
jgi:hypothetical protein